MVLELLINPKKMVNHPLKIFFIGFLYSLVAVFLSFWIFEGYISLMMITLLTIAVMPFFHKLIMVEEKKELEAKSEISLLKEHSKTIFSLLWLFVGFLTAFLILCVFLPAGFFEKVFSIQIETIMAVKGGATGSFIGDFNTVSAIFLNNLQVLIFCVIFSLFYGAGAILILTWNASVMATAIGVHIRELVFGSGGGVWHYINMTSAGLLKYMFHGIPEIAAYFIGALASGMMAFAFVNHDLRGKKFKKIMKDVVNLLVLAVVILFVAALVEVYITPRII